MRREDIHIRDPFILPYEGRYYMYGTGAPNIADIDLGRQFWCYVSEDLEEWSDAILCFDAPDDFWAEYNFWAPEVHLYRGRFYMLASFCAPGKMRATQALVADDPRGPYQVVGDTLTPKTWMSLDGTLYIEDDIPYLVFCHEWTQIRDGEIAVLRLKEDLTEAIGEPTVLFRASASGWSQEITTSGMTGRVTDGPYLVPSGRALTMFWSSFHEGAYAVGMAVSKTKSLFGPWEHVDRLLFEKDGGHGMCFTAFDGKQYFALHQPNQPKLERPCFFEIRETEDGFTLL